jgi:hypothetical protein
MHISENIRDIGSPVGFDQEVGESTLARSYDVSGIFSN